MTDALLPTPPLGLLPGAALVLAPDGPVTSANADATAMFGLDPAGGELAALIPDPSRMWAAVEGLAPGATVAPIPLEGRRANGVPFAVDARVSVLEDGRLLCLVRELDRQAPGTLDAAFDAMPIGMALFNTDGIERSVTASVGVAAVESPADALSAADRAMYAAKAVGGGRVRVAS